MNPLFASEPPLDPVEPPKGQVNPPPGNSIKTVQQIHKTGTAVLIKTAVPVFGWVQTLFGIWLKKSAEKFEMCANV